MASRRPQGVSLKSVTLGMLLLAVPFGSWAPGVAQSHSPRAPDVATQEKRFEEAFQKALEMSDEEPMNVFQTWGVVLMDAVILERRKAMAGAPEGAEPPPVDGQAVTERVLERWHEARPDSAGPDLFRAFRFQPDPEAKRVAILAVFERYPDDPLAVSAATNEMRQAGETDRAREVIEGFASRHPDRSIAYQFLAQDAGDNVTRMSEILERWARALPRDPKLVSALMGSNLARNDPEAAGRILDAYFAARPGKAEDFQACREVAERGPESFKAAARACVARTAADPDAPAWVVEQATSTLVGAAAAKGDWDGLVSALGQLEPAARARALAAAADKMPAPERCADRVALLSEAAKALGDDESFYGAAAGSLYPCAHQPAADGLFLDLLRRAPESRVENVLGRWITRVNGEVRGNLPAGAIGVLEERLQKEPDGSRLYRALDLAYQASGEEEKRFALLGRWQQAAPDSFWPDQAVDLAGAFVARGKPGEAVKVLERQLERNFSPKVVEALWELYREAEGEGRAESFADELISSGDPARAGSGHHMAARSALERGDFGAAERHYWQALESERVEGKDVGIELLATMTLAGESTQLEPAARRICQEAHLAQDAGEVPECAAKLLTRVGQGEAASHFLQAQAANLPSDLESLRSMARTAESADQVDIAERALRRILELDPKDENNWAGLGGFLEKHGRADEVVGLLDRSRDQFSPPPVNLARSAARALTAAGELKRAIEILLEARGTLPATEGGDWSRDWINKELRDAYAALGKGTARVASSSAPPPSPSLPGSEPVKFPETATAAELREAADALAAGQKGRYDPIAAGRLYARGAAEGDPRASLRLAIVEELHPEQAPAGAPSPGELYGRSAGAVQALAEKGDPQAEYLVGTAALIGLGQPADFAKAKRWLEPAAEGGESWAWHNLGWMEETGRGFDHPDVAAAITSYRKGAEAGNAQSMLAFARLTFGQNGGSVEVCKEAAGWLELSARDGNAAAAGYLSKVLLYGHGGCLPPDGKAALPWLEAAAASHQRGSSYDLGLALVLNGSDAAARAQGMSLLERSAARDDTLAVDTLAFFYATGIGIRRDAAKAERLLDEGTRLGSDCLNRLREQSGRSEVLEGLLGEGLKRLGTFADAGDPAAATLLARLSALGAAGPVAPERIVALARKGAAGGKGMAMRVLASAYLNAEPRTWTPSVEASSAPAPMG